MLNFLVLVPYFADNFFEQILHCNNTECSAVFIRNYRKMNFGAFECIQNFWKLLCFKHKVRRLHKLLNIGRFTVCKSFEIISCMENADNMVNRAFVHGNSWISVFNDDILDFFRRVINADKCDINPRSENFLGSSFVKVKCGANHLAFALFKNAFFLNALNNVFKLIFSNWRSVTAAACNL